MILKIQFSAKKSQKNMLHRNTYPSKMHKKMLSVLSLAEA